ncbi:hypothetical protein T492DRAFT_1079692 [Pavlovales sp. CCMP2436]|nr:hypothetical protein T492DRAFT_1079692 [Pavlovales sp. CCMP2436]
MGVVNQARLNALQDRLTSPADVHAALQEHPDLSFEALLSLLAHRTRQHVKKQKSAARRNHGRNTPDLVSAFESGKSLAVIAQDERLPVSELIRLMIPGLLDRQILLSRPGRQEPKLKDLLIDPHLIKEQWRETILAAIDVDNLCSPASDESARLIGLEYEHTLLRKLSAHGVPFRTEEQLRLLGTYKTPDVELQIPIEVDGRVVNWIDSKAMFGDRASHSEHQKQFRSYVNRLGAGMVIYWFGYADSLPPDADVTVVDTFPTSLRL